MIEFLEVGTPAINSTAQIYQIVIAFLILIVNLFTMFGIFYLVIGNGALDRINEIRTEKAKVREAKKRGLI